MPDDMAPGITVTGINDSDRCAWDEFVARRADATFFHDVRWKDVIESALGHRTHYLAARYGRDIVGILPLAEVKSRLFGYRLVSNPCCVYGGPIGDTVGAQTALLAAAKALAVKLRVDALELRPLPGGSDAHLYSAGDWQTKDLYVTFRKSIFDDAERNLKAIPRRQRAMVRKGIAFGLSSVVTGDVRRFYRIYAESVRNLGTPVFSLRYFETLCDVFSGNVELSIISHGEQDIAAVMSFYFRNEVLPYYGGSRPIARDLKGNDFMYWDLMCRAAHRGCRVFDFGRSKKGTGSYSFKRNWGFVDESLPYRYGMVTGKDIPDVNPTNPKYRLFIAGWKKMPLPLANAVGPHLARHLG